MSEFMDNISKVHINETNFLVSEERFKYPDMGDYYINSVSSPYLKKLSDEWNEENDEAAKVFYYEKPPVYDSGLGDYPMDGVTLFKAKVNTSELDRLTGRYDGDTLRFNTDTIEVGADPSVKDRLVNSFEERMKELEGKSGTMGMRFLGIDAPEVRKYSLELYSEEKSGKLDTSIATYGQIKNDTKKYIIKRSDARPDDSIVNLMKMVDGRDELWHEYTTSEPSNNELRERDLKIGDGYLKYEILTKEGESDPARALAAVKAQELIKELTDKAGGEVYFMVDRNSLSRSSSKYPSEFEGVDSFSKGIDKWKYMYSQIKDYNPYTYAGYNQWGQDLHGRWLGAAYVKIDGQFINLAKYLIANIPEIEVLPDFTDSPSYESSGGIASDAFNLQSYDFKNRKLADLGSGMAGEFDDRRKVQREIFRMDFDEMKDWNVTVGDSTFFVPPTSIRVNSRTTHERLPVLRGKGSITKGSPKVQRTLELSLYFNEERGINGYKYNTTLPSGEEVTYHMNGLRALISQFKFTPFLPIDNTYINTILNIDAVTLMNVQIVTNPSYPRLISCVLTLQEFDFTQYMPEIPLNTDEDADYYNPFAGTINFELMRWYYQRPIMLGEKVKDLDINSIEYIKQTEGHRTALLPMRFDNSGVVFYKANEDHLKKMLQVKMEAINNRNRTTPKLTDGEKELAQEMGVVYDALKEMMGNDEVNAAIKNLVSPATNQYLSIERYNQVKDEFGDAITGLYFGVRELEKDGSTKVEQEQVVTDRINNLLQLVAGHMSTANNKGIGTILSSPKFVLQAGEEKDAKLSGEKYKRQNVTIGVVFDIKRDYLTNDFQISDLIKDAELKIGKQLDKYSKNGQVFIPITGSFYLKEEDGIIRSEHPIMKDEDSQLKFDSAHTGIQFISYLKGVGDELIVNNNETMEDEVAGLKDALDNASIDTLLYEVHPIGDVHIKNLACVYGNSYTEIGLNGSEGYAPQYMGGQDAVIEITLETTDIRAVGAINAIPKISAELVRQYRLVMPSGPFRIDSDITRLLGINEVLVEDQTISTVPGHPGLYQITMRLMSIDRTLRNREGIEKINEFAHGGATTNDNAAQIRINTFSDLKSTFGKAELFPDLELPTIKELGTARFDFVRHMFDHERVYPDPDFYFVYGHVIQSEIFREAVINHLGEDGDVYSWSDKNGGEVHTSVDKNGKGIKQEEINDVAKEAKAAGEKVVDVKNAAPETKRELFLKKMDVINKLNASATEDVWHIGEDVKVMLMEDAYEDLLIHHEQCLNSGKSTAETDWIYEALSNARKASKNIKKYLDKPITRIEFHDEDNEYQHRYGSKQVKETLWTAARRFIQEDEVSEILTLLDVKMDDKFKKAVEGIIYSAACAATGNREYNPEEDTEWRPRKDFIGYRFSNSQDDTGKVEITDISEGVDQAVEFGPFRMTMHSKSMINQMIGSNPNSKRFKDEDKNDINTQLFLLDPYYRDKATIEEIKEYKDATIGNMQFAVDGFMRLVLHWISVMIDDKIIPNVNFDVLSEEFDKELTTAYFAADQVKKDEYDKKEAMYLQEQINQYMDFLKDSERPIDAGKIFLGCLVALTNKSVYPIIKSKSYPDMNALKANATSSSSPRDMASAESSKLRKFFLALIGNEVVNSTADLSIKYDDPIQDYKRSTLEKKYIELAEDPTQYTKHAFYDMCVNDMRGRMARAFPTFYMVLVDEGREIGMWKLNDNFYNVNSISEIQVSKSRKIAADTCRVVMTNLFHTYTTDDEDKKVEYNYNYKDIFNSIFNPSAIYTAEQAKRMRQQSLNRVKLETGTRVHIRMGYGSNASTLPVAFNGRITEINAGEIMEIICQGDGVELLNPIYENTDAEEMLEKDRIDGGFFANIFNNAATPKEILDAILTTKGAWLDETLREVTNGYYRNPHPFGIMNFGDPKFTDIFKNGEVTQNIFEAISKPKWGDLEDGISGAYAMSESPKISIELAGKTFWDVLHICTSVSPDYLCGVVPFGMRSTIFHGHPRFYYAFDYIVDENGAVHEKRKPYQQYHIITSYSDIIKNTFTASAMNVRTNAQGTYKSVGRTGFGTRTNNTGRLYSDWDIYPEHQKGMIYDTQLYDKGVPLVAPIMKPFQHWSDTDGWLQSGKKLAWRMTASALKDSMKEMYTGEVILLGSPSIKPNDRIFMSDSYENMTGQFLVEAVVHSLSSDTGFTSTIVPDCIATVDDQHELAVQTFAGGIFKSAMTGYLATLGMSLAFGKGATPLLSMVEGTASKFGSRVNKLTRGKAGDLANKTKDAAKKYNAAKNAVKAVRTGRSLLLAAAPTGPAGWIAAATILAAEIGVSFILAKTVTDLMERKMENTQVLQVFPVMKNGKALTAGLTGNVGLVYGSSNYNSVGSMDKVFGWLDTENNGFGPIRNFLIEWLASDEMRNLAAKRNQTLAKETTSSDESVQREIDTLHLMKGIAAGESRKIAGYRKLLLSPRIQVDDEEFDEKYSNVLDKISHLDNVAIEVQNRITADNVFIKSDAVLKKAMDEGIFKMIWDEDLTGSDYETKDFLIQGVKVRTKAIIEYIDGVKTYNIPFLKEDALDILKEIILRCSALMPNFEPEKKMKNESFVTIKSALIVGDASTSSSTGYSFVLQPDGKDKEKFLKEAVQSIENDFDRAYERGESLNKKILVAEEKEGNKMFVTVLPPEV